MITSTAFTTSVVALALGRCHLIMVVVGGGGDGWFEGGAGDSSAGGGSGYVSR